MLSDCLLKYFLHSAHSVSLVLIIVYVIDERKLSEWTETSLMPELSDPEWFWSSQVACLKRRMQTLPIETNCCMLQRRMQYVDVCLADCKFTSIEWLTMTNRKTQFLYSVSLFLTRQLSNRIALCCYTHRTQFHISYSWFIWEYLQVVSLEFVSFRVICAYTHDKATAMQAISIILSVNAARHSSSLCNNKNHKRNKALIEVANPSTC